MSKPPKNPSNKDDDEKNKNKTSKKPKNNNKQIVVYKKIKWDLSKNEIYYFDFSKNKLVLTQNQNEIYLDKCREFFNKDDENYTINPLFAYKNDLKIKQKQILMSNKTNRTHNANNIIYNNIDNFNNFKKNNNVRNNNKYNKHTDKCKNVYSIINTFENYTSKNNEIFKEFNSIYFNNLQNKNNKSNKSKKNKYSISENKLNDILSIISKKHDIECSKETIIYNKQKLNRINDENSTHIITPKDSPKYTGDSYDKLNKFSLSSENIKINIKPKKPRYDLYRKRSIYNSNVKYNINKNIENIKQVNINVEITCISDILKLIDDYPLKFDVKYNINMRALHNIKEPLEQLNEMIGMNSLKENVVDQILYYVQDFHKSNDNDDFMHTVIYGPPGTGKTEVAKIIGKLFSKLGVLKKNVFKKVTRADLIAGYLGQTAIKTKDAVNAALGGVLFIDEAYALGNSEKRDIFAKECIDTLCESLSDNKNNLMVIIAGYEKELKYCFFEYNKGLDSRFPWRYKTDDYKPNELRMIFNKKINEIDWKISDKIKDSWFEKNKDYFKFYGRDMETLLSKVKISHSRRVFCLPDKEKKTITEKDMDKGFSAFISNDEVKRRIESNNSIIRSMYM